MSYLEYCSNCGNKNERNHIDGNIRFHCVICKSIHYENPKPTATLICPKENSILLGRRAFDPGKGEWGLPGGFMELNETLEEAAQRELKEETSIKTVELIKELNEWMSYDLPKNLLGKLWKGKYRGQKQKWFIMKFLGKNDEINIKTKNPEFLEWKWIKSTDLSKVVVDFKVNVYKKIFEELSVLKLN